MPASLSSEYLWQFTTRAPIVGLNQEDRSGQVAAFDQDGGVYLLDEKGALRLELGFSRPVRSVRVVAEGKGLVVLDSEGWLSRFDAKGKRLWDQYIDERATCMDARHEGQGIAVGCMHGLLTFHNAQGKKLRSLYLTHPIGFVKFAYDLPFIVAANRNGQFSLIDPSFKFLWQEDMHTICSGIDVNCDASLILLTALTEGVLAFTKNREVLGAYDVGDAILASALCQKGQRILAVNQAGRIHLINRQGNLEYFLDTGEPISRLDLNYPGDCVAFQSGTSMIKSLCFLDGKPSGDNGGQTYRALAHEIAASARSSEGSGSGKTALHASTLWERELEGGGEAELRLTAHGAYCLALSEFNVLAVRDAQGQLLWQECLDPSRSHQLHYSRAGNAILVANKDYVDYFTCDGQKIKRLETKAQHIAVHDLGVNFAIGTVESKVGLFDKQGQCVWSQILGIPILHLKVSPNAKGIFVACSDDTLRLFRQEGKLGWEKKLLPKDHKVMLGNEIPYYNHKPVFHAAPGYAFKDKVIGAGTNFILSREGILLAREDGQLMFMNERGDCKWEHALQDPIILLENLGQVFWVRTKSGKDYLFDLGGQKLHMREVIPGARQFVKDKQKDLLMVESQENLLMCSNISKNSRLWEHKAQTKITQFHVDLTGSRLVYLAAGKIHCLAVHPAEEQSTEMAASQAVAFLEF